MKLAGFKIVALAFSLIQSSDAATLNACNLNSPQSVTNKTQRIVFGQDIPQGEFIPYQVSLQYHTRSGEHRHFCGGSIIAPNRVLTAGHCCDGLNAKRMSVLAGIRSLNSTDGVRSQVTKCTMHESYMKSEFNDLAVLSIEPPLTFTKSIAAIDVSDDDEVAGDVPVTLTGWGLRLPLEFPFLPPDMASINFPTVLQRLNYFTLSNTECQNLGMSDVSNKEICARRKVALPQGACIGDSGGPLVTKSGNKIKQVGVVSYGFRVCGLLPDVYTRVSMYKDWLKRQMA